MIYIPRNLSSEQLKYLMKEAVPKELEDSVEEYINKYTGTVRFLDEFLQKMGTDNIFEALLNVQILQADYGDFKSGIAKGTSMSNQMLYKTFFEIRSKLTANTLISGSTLLPKIINTFKNLEFVSENYKNKIDELTNILVSAKKKKENEKKHIKEMQKINYHWTKTIEEILEDESKIKSVQSPSERKQIQHILGLNKTVLKTYKQLDSIIAENVSFLVDDSITDLPLDPSGNTLNYIQKIQDRGEYVEDIIIAFKDNLKRKTGYINEDRRKYMWTVLKMYELRNRKLNPKDAFGGFIKDIEEIMKFDKNHEVIQKIGLPRLSKIKDVLKKKEISMFDLQRFLDTNIVNIRVALNEGYFNNKEKFNKKEYMNTINAFKDIYDFEKDRLNNSEMDFILSIKDKQNLKNMLRTEYGLLIKERNRFESRNHELFKERVNGISLINRKLIALKEYRESDADEKEKKISLAYLRKNSLKLIEEIESKTIEDIATRILDYSFNIKAISSDEINHLKTYRKIGIFDEKLIEKLKTKKNKNGLSEYDFLKSLKSIKESKEITDIVKSTNNHELVLLGHKRLLEKNHYTKEYYDSLKSYFNFNNQLNSELKNMNDKEKIKIQEIKRKIEEYKQNKFVIILDSKYLNLYKSSINEVLENKLSSWKDENYLTFKYLKKENLDTILNEINSIQEMDSETLKKLDSIISFDNRKKLEKEGYNLKGMYYSIQGIKNKPYKISAETKKVINKLYNKVKNNLKR